MNEKVKLFISKHWLWLWLVAIAVVFTFFSTYFTFWGDEIASVDYAISPMRDFVAGYLANPDIYHPPLYYLFLNIWQKIFQITAHNDYLFSVYSIIFFCLSVFWVAKKWLKDDKERIWFLALATCSSYFFMYSHMVRYYTMAAFLYLVAFHYLLEWLKNKNNKILIKLLVAIFFLLYTDYPSFLFFVVSSSFWLWRDNSYRFSVLWFKKIFGYLTALFILILPAVFLNLLSGWQGKSGGGLISISIGAALIKFFSGLIFIPYHILVGEYFNPIVTPFFGLFLLAILIMLIKSYRQQAESNEKKELRGYFYFVIINFLSASLLLSTVVHGYPIFSFARFLIPVALVMLVLMVKLFSNGFRRWLLIGLLLINVFVIYNNISKQYFINPIYFFPKEEALDLARSNPGLILVGTNGKRNTEAGMYLMEKYFPGRAVYGLDEIKGNFLIFVEPLLTFNGDISVAVEKEYNAKVIQSGGYDNITPINKWFMKKIGFLNRDFKYYYFVLEKNSP